MDIKEVYKKYKHFDKFFCDTMFIDSVQAQARHDMWQAIRAAATGGTPAEQQATQQSTPFPSKEGERIMKKTGRCPVCGSYSQS